MCIIIYSPRGYIPKQQLRESLANNPDGWGVMWPQNGRLQIVNGLTEESFWHEWEWIQSEEESPLVFHARIGTHGSKSLDNCHPFVVPHHGELAVAHNGIIHRMEKKGSKSDTRNFVDDVLAYLPLGFQAMPAHRELIRGYIGHSKLVFLDGEGNVNILNEGMGHWSKGRWYSNDSYKARFIKWVPYKDTKGGIGFAPATPAQAAKADLQKLPAHYHPPTVAPAAAPQTNGKTLPPAVNQWTQLNLLIK